MHGEEIARRPVLLPRAHPGQAFADAPLHLQHMGHGMMRPGIRRMKLHRLAAGFLGTAVFAAFLEAKRLHAEHRMIARHVAAPFRQHTRDPVAQGAGVAAEIVEDVADLQGQGIARMIEQDILETLARLVVLAGNQRVDGGDMLTLARVGRQRYRRRAAVARRRQARRLGPGQEDIGLEQMRQGEARRGRDGPVDGGDRIADVALQLGLRLLEEGKRCRIGTRDGVTP